MGLSRSSSHPYVDAVGITTHNDRYLNLARGKWHWQITAWSALLVVAVQAAAIAYMYGQRKEYAYAVQIDELGIANYVRELSSQELHSTYVISAQVGSFIKGIRTITTDPVLFKQGMNAAYAVCLKDAQGYIRNYYETEEKPLDLIAKGASVLPKNIEVAPLSSTSYRVRWKEELVQHEAVLAESQWEATVQVELTHPADLTTEQRQRNPLGVWIAYVNWFKV